MVALACKYLQDLEREAEDYASTQCNPVKTENRETGGWSSGVQSACEVRGKALIKKKIAKQDDLISNLTLKENIIQKVCNTK